MPFEDLSKEELIGILELVEGAQRCSTSKDLQKLMVKAAPLLEAEYSLCGLVRTGSDGRPAVTSYVKGNYPEEWVRRYLEKGYHLKDPVVRYHTNFAFTQTWSEVIRQFDDDASRLVVEEASDCGLKFGLTGAIYVPEISNIALFIFAGKNDSFGAHQKRITDIITMHFAKALVDCGGGELFSAGRQFADEGHPTAREGKAW